ncbi:ATP-binding cassette domain-containing protein [Alkalihalobacillus trypoxylicola]|uniref:Caunorubicin/doxorubicin resistance ATP-binding protein n=1 Tax=Alkalihalobacillus trypoxylicola TaxID=519424 RepID=A0A162EZV6_9BACI|nr:ATP-binding cassette domain-containing protein [Alkalihalobacillus trypoxylicola]KYG34134.1 caunorubicin/doxorubicin resistance ATP-binding protein [Alkalihalobacillus trypoxylicola]
MVGEENVLAVEAKGLVKIFGEHRAVDGVDLKIKKGVVYGFLGPNGAGKTTTIRMLSTLLKPDGGEAKVFGYDIKTETAEVRKRISLTGQYASLDEDLTGYENLVMLSKLVGYTKKEAKERAVQLLKAFRLEEASNRQVKKYSGGMRRRIDIAGSIVLTPDLLFLDEPTTGLDPRSRNQVWDIIRILVKAGTTVLLTTQYLEEADQLADRIAVINDGKIIAEGTPNELKSSVGSNLLAITLKNENEREQAMELVARSFPSSIQTLNEPGSFHIRIDQSLEAIEILKVLTEQSIVVDSFTLGQPSLDEVFLSLTGQKPTDEAIERGGSHE